MNKKIISVCVILAVGGGLFVYQQTADKEVKERIDSYVNLINKDQGDRIKLTHGDYGFNFKQEIFVKEVKIFDKINKKEVLLGDLNIKNLDTKHKVPYHMSVSFKNAEYDVKQLEEYAINKEARSILNNLSQGKDTMTTSFNFNYEYNPEKNHSLSINLKEEVKKAVSFDFSLNVSDLNLIAINDKKADLMLNPQLALTELSKVKLNGLSINIDDERLMEAFLEEIVNNDKKINTVEEAEVEVEQYVRTFQKRRHSLNEDFYEEFIKYIKNKKGLSLSVNPKGDLTAFELFQKVSQELSKNPKSELEILGVEFKSK